MECEWGTNAKAFKRKRVCSEPEHAELNQKIPYNEWWCSKQGKWWSIHIEHAFDGRHDRSRKGNELKIDWISAGEHLIHTGYQLLYVATDIVVMSLFWRLMRNTVFHLTHYGHDVARMEACHLRDHRGTYGTQHEQGKEYGYRTFSPHRCFVQRQS